jgi:putative ATP-binding cassette transporter
MLISEPGHPEPETPSAKFLAAVRGVVRASGESALEVLDSGLSGAPAIDESTRFRVGSLSKVFTAVGVLRLVQQGALTLEDELTTLIPEFKFRNGFKTAEPIRVKHLLSHSSGLPVEAKAELTFVSSWQLRELLPLLEDHALAFPPGQRAQYSNVGYDVLGLVIERARGQSFEHYMHEHVFTALGMTNAGYHADGNTVPGFFRDAGGALLESPEQPANDLPAGGLLLSARDFAAFLSWVLEASDDNEPFLRSSLKRLLLTPSAYRPLDGVRQQPGVP